MGANTSLKIRHHGAGAVGLCLAAGVALAACGPSSSPQGQLRSGVASLASSPSVSVDIHLRATPAQLRSLDPKIPTPYARLLAGASLVVQETTTNGQSLAAASKAARSSPAKSLAGIETDMTLTAAGSKLVELRLVKGTLYGRADVKSILGLAGQGQAALGKAESRIPPGAAYDFARAALQGKWVSLAAAPLVKAARGSTSSSLSPAKQTDLVHALEATLAKDVAVTKAGSANGTSDLLVTTDLHTLLAGVISDVMAVVPSASRAGAASLAKVPHRQVKLHAFVKGSTLTAVQIDLGQFAAGAKGGANHHLVLAADISHPQVTVSAPKGAVAISPSTLRQLSRSARALGAGGMGTATSMATATSMVAPS